MSHERQNPYRNESELYDSLRDAPLKDLLAALTGGVRNLVLREAELAKTEARADLRSSVLAAKGLGAAALCGFLAANLLLVAGVLALAAILPAWAAALVVAAPFLAASLALGAFGWSRRPRTPLAATRHTLKEDLEWAKSRLS